MGQGYEDHLVTQEADIPEVERVQWRKIDASYAKGLYTNDIQRLYKVASAIVHISQQDLDLSTYIGQIASLKEEFLTVMPLTPDVGAQQTQLDKFFMVLTLIGLRPDLEPVRDQILGSSSVPSLDDVFARLLRRSGNRGRGQRPHCTYCNKLGHTRDRCYQLHGRPPRTAHVAQSSDSQLPQPPSSSASQASQASVASVAQPGNASACLTHTSSLGPWILDSGASDHLSGNKDLFSSITTTSALPTVTLANGSQTVAKGIGLALPLPSLPLTSVLYTPDDRSTGKNDWHRTPCQLGKHTRVSFPKRLNNRAKSPFELVHTDVWGPCRTASTLGFQYFVTFIDDYSRCTCPFTSFMSHHGILHQSSCAHTPQQNGVAERKNRHLVETARTILLHSNVPFRFWGDAVLTACYLINRMPSSVLHDQIPHSLLFPDQPLYFLPPRVFGCTCFVHILTPGQDKLSAKAMKCLFLGYSRLQKGYRCYSLETHRYFISADVTFFEDSPFFSTTSESLPVSEVLPIPIVSPPDAMPPRPLQVYHRRPRVVAPLPFAEAPADSLPIPSASPAPALPSPMITHCCSESTHEALSHPGWRQAMVDEMAALHSNGTWDLVVLPSGKSTVGVVGSMQLRLVLMIASVRLLLSMAAMCSWPLYQLDIKNAFLHGDLAEEVYMEQPPGFVAQGESGLVCSTADHSVFYHHNSLGQCIYLVVYVDDIVITGSDQDGIQKLKQHLFTHFQTKDLGKLKYFLGIEIAQSSSGVVLSQRKTGEPLGDPGRYRRLVGKLNYLTITRPDISFPVSVVSQFLQSPCDSHWDAVIRILRYIKSTPGQGVYENRGHTQLLVTQMQIGLAHPQIDVPLQELRFGKDEQMKLICDNQPHYILHPIQSFMKGPSILKLTVIH
ncbi:Retrovirus-related Pol polyprotein from transposon TNT 1-94 [Vitis vinifera]|uniref:Retrovirus-related Pol polyprotein from transposon TNT 1-94 n=1 Tax=Vitis vinifera TaxID=29760 RepID=A0A438H2D2_VITVI|nr:Retrovirus-related Pol polyprotein from transposon TNT 1-94 [Vitis vinifera]